MKFTLTLALLLFLAVNLFGQLEKTIHQTFDVGDSKEIALDLHGDYQVIPWAGNNVMTETKIEIFNASTHIFNYLIEHQQRYTIISESNGDVFKLYSYDKSREAVQTRHGTCTEIITLRIFIPDRFISHGASSFVKTN